MALRTVVVVGASLAGLRATETLRREGFDGRIVLVGAEPHLPYDRPPLSKELSPASRSRRTSCCASRRTTTSTSNWRLGVRATALDVGRRACSPSTVGEPLAFDGAGDRDRRGTPRGCPAQPELDGIFVLRTLDDALALRARLDAGPKVVVIGAGFIGSEVAATCRHAAST